MVAFQVKIAELTKALADQEEAFRRREHEIYTGLFEVLDALDNLDKAYQEKADALDKTAKKLLKSQRAIAEKLKRTLKERHVVPIELPEDGKARVDLCRIVSIESVPGAENERIIRVEKTGYIDKEHNLVLRKADVVTVSND
jgi:molecular chaperone GrpE (heat shock protein)